MADEEEKKEGGEEEKTEDKAGEEKKEEAKEEPKEEKKDEEPPKGDAAATPPSSPPAAEPPKEEAKPPEPPKEEPKPAEPAKEAPKPKAAAKPSIPMVTVAEEEEGRKDKEKHDRMVMKILATKGAKPISDEDYLKVRLFYKIFREQEVGTGQCCKVFKSAHKGQDQAVKIIPLTGEVPLRYKEHLNAIGLNVARHLLENPNARIVPFYEIYSTPTKVYVFMELLLDGNLEEYSKKNHVKEKQLKKWVREVAEGMLFLLNNGIAHRNIRPVHAIFTAKRESIKLGGFDMASVVWNPEKSCPLKEKKVHRDDFLPYMAPEVIKEDHSAVAADIFSLGCFIVFCHTRKYPFDISTKKHDAVWPIHCRRNDFSPSKDLKDLLTKMFALDAAKRISISSILSHPWITSA